MAAYLYLNAALYLLFAIWCTVAADSTAKNLGYLTLSPGGHSEYLVIYGGLQLGLAAMFFLFARNPAHFRIGILIALAIYTPIVLYRAVTVVRYWPVTTLTLATGLLETGLLLCAFWLWNQGH